MGGTITSEKTSFVIGLMVAFAATAEGQPPCADPHWLENPPPWPDSLVTAIDQFPGGDILAAGSFDTIGGITAKRVARWNGKNWAPVGPGFAGALNHPSMDCALAMDDDESVMIGGSFSASLGFPADGLCHWDGASWNPVGQGLNQYAHVNALAERHGQVAIGGDFTIVGDSIMTYVAIWKDGNLIPIAAGEWTLVRSLAYLTNGDIVACGNFASIGGTSANDIARWDGTAWTALGTGTPKPGEWMSTIFVLPGDELVVGGQFAMVGSALALNISRWDGQSWHALGNGVKYPVDAVARFPSGDLVTGSSKYGGGFNLINRWDGANWKPVGTGMSGVVHGLEVRSDGDLVAVGSFTYIGPTPQPYFAVYGCESLPCTPDCDASGSLTIDDFICFQTLFAVGDPKADCDASGSLTIDDFICFQSLYAIGC